MHKSVLPFNYMAGRRVEVLEELIVAVSQIVSICKRGSGHIDSSVLDFHRDLGAHYTQSSSSFMNHES